VAGHTATGQHQHRLDQDLAPVVEWSEFTGSWDTTRERIAKVQPVGNGPKSVESDVAHHLAAA
jgi:hypothetical protein